MSLPHAGGIGKVTTECKNEWRVIAVGVGPVSEAWRKAPRWGTCGTTLPYWMLEYAGHTRIGGTSGLAWQDIIGPRPGPWFPFFHPSIYDSLIQIIDLFQDTIGNLVPPGDDRYLSAFKLHVLSKGFPSFFPLHVDHPNGFRLEGGATNRVTYCSRQPQHLNALGGSASFIQNKTNSVAADKKIASTGGSEIGLIDTYFVAMIHRK